MVDGMLDVRGRSGVGMVMLMFVTVPRFREARVKLYFLPFDV